MEIYITETGKVVTEQEFRSMYLNVSFPTQLTEDLINQFGGEVVLEGPQATVEPPYQFSQRSGIEKIDGKWFTKYIAGPVFTSFTGEDGAIVTPAEQEKAYKIHKDSEQATQVRAERNRRIAELDWTQGKDIPDNISIPAAKVRQELRDVPSQVGFPWTIVWPELKA